MSPWRSLSFNGYSVSLAEDGVEALNSIACDRPDAVVLDVMMPGSTGSRSAGSCARPGDDLPILVLTARDSVSEQVADLDAGADDYPPKTVRPRGAAGPMRALLRRTGPGRQRRGRPR